MTQTQDEQEAASRYHRTKYTSRWWQGGAGGGARGVGGVNRTSNRGDNMVEAGQEAMEGDGTSNNEEGIEQGLGARHARCMTGGDQGRGNGKRGALAALCYDCSHLLPFINS